jgi:hypothetical protein
MLWPSLSPTDIRGRDASLTRRILEDDGIALVVSAAIPCERAPLGIAAMRHGKDFMVDKPGMTSLAQLAEVRKVQRETETRGQSLDWGTGQTIAVEIERQLDYIPGEDHDSGASPGVAI